MKNLPAPPRGTRSPSSLAPETNWSRQEARGGSAAQKIDTETTDYDGGSGSDPSRYAFAGGFAPDAVAPTCKGLEAVWHAAMDLPRAEFLRIAKDVMDAVWTQPLSDAAPHPVMKNAADLVDALNRGWAYNANEGDCLYTVFADIRAIGRDGQIVGVGTQAPDGAFIHDGRELVAWRERRWNAQRGPDHRKDMAARHALRAI